MSILVSERSSLRTVVISEHVEVFDEHDLAILAAAETRNRFDLPAGTHLTVTLTPIGAMVVNFTVEEEVCATAGGAGAGPWGELCASDCGCDPRVMCRANSACPRNRVG